MNATVLFQLVVSFERFATVLTFERPVIRVSQKVMTQIGRRAISVFRILKFRPKIEPTEKSVGKIFSSEVQNLNHGLNFLSQRLHSNSFSFA